MRIHIVTFTIVLFLQRTTAPLIERPVLTDTYYCKTGDRRVLFSEYYQSRLINDPAKESIICGIGEVEILFQPFDAEEVLTNYQRIQSTTADCIDEKTIVIGYSPQKLNTETSDIRESRKNFIEISCVSNSAVTIHFDGILPSMGNILKAEFDSQNSEFRTQVLIPYQPEKTGMYTFKPTKQNLAYTTEVSFYLFFKDQPGKIWSYDSTQGNLLNAFEDPEDSKNIVLPCRVNDHSIQDVYLSSTSNMAGETLSNETYHNLTYDQYRGFVVEKDVFNDLFNNTMPVQLNARIVYCVNKNGSSMPVKVNANIPKHPYEPIIAMQPGSLVSWDFEIDKGFDTLQCKLKYSDENDILYVTNMYLASLGDYDFLYPCLPSSKNCKWNSFWPPKKKSVLHFPFTSNKLLRQCRQSDEYDTEIKCQIRDVFKSGVAMCSREKGQDYIAEIYFTGLDEKLYFRRSFKLVPASSLLRIELKSSDSENQMFSSQVKTFMCTIVGFVMHPGCLWRIVYKDKNERIRDSTDREKYPAFIPQTYAESLDVILDENMEKVVCKGFVRGELSHEVEYVESSVSIVVKATQPPIISKPKTIYIIGENETSIIINCFVRAIPMPKISWHFNKSAAGLNTRFLSEPDGSWRLELKLDNSTNTLIPGIYMCFAINVGGFDYAKFNAVLSSEVIVPPLEAASGLTYLSFSLILVVVLILGIGSVVLLRVFRTKSAKILSDKDLDNFFHGAEETSEQKEHHDYVCLPYDDQNELALKDFKIDYEDVLGEGFYGKVLMGKVRGKDAAAKTVKEGIQREVLLALLTEIKIMSRLEEHPNIVSFIGTNTKRLASGEVYLFVEFCAGGTVEKYLRRMSKFVSQGSKFEVAYENQMSQKLLVDWSLQTAQGMEYLSSMKIIHGDLAARNLLLKNIDTIKISDFGLARQLHNYSVYTKKSTQPLPWRHMAPESLSDMEFSVKSDVWAFGVTLWEMNSLGKIPYPGAQWNQDFIAALKDGMKLEKPKDCLDDVCTLMDKCWILQPGARASFNELSTALGHIKESLRNDQVYCNPATTTSCIERKKQTH